MQKIGDYMNVLTCLIKLNYVIYWLIQNDTLHRGVNMHQNSVLLHFPIADIMENKNSVNDI